MTQRRCTYGMLCALCAMVAALVAACGQQQPEPEPEPRTQRTIHDVGPPDCQHLTVPVRVRQRVSTPALSRSKDRWVHTWGAWKDKGRSLRHAVAADCLHVIDAMAANAALPDLRIKKLNRCGAGDMRATGGDCFMIVDPAPTNAAFPRLAGRKLLKFPIITVNVGAGPSEIIADRTLAHAADWQAYQTLYTAQGRRLGSVYEPGVEFYFAGDEHDHWHVRDFDSYEILDASGSTVRRSEKHGYCQQDNTTYDPMAGEPGVPPEPGVYLDATSCGEGLPRALTIIHGLSRGWGDTYPTSLPDQAIDITGLPDGTYTVRVHADVQNTVAESDETNNTASMRVTIWGDQVTTHPATERGGIS